MRLAKTDDQEKIIHYLKEHHAECLYMYIDIAKYGVEGENMRVWIDNREDDINTVVMKYFSGISIFSAFDEWDAEGAAEVINEEKPSSITGKKELIDKIECFLVNEYVKDYEYVFKFTKFQNVDVDAVIERATEDDLLEAAQLVTKDERVGGHYTVEELASQYRERMRTGMGRNFIIREEGKIVGHIASYAEFAGLATTSGLVVDPECRSSMYGAALERHLLESLWDDGFDVYTYVITKLRYRLLLAMGNECIGQFGKLTLKEDDK